MKNTVSLVVPFRSLTEDKLHGIIKVLHVDDPILGAAGKLFLILGDGLLLLDVLQENLFVVDVRLGISLLILMTLSKIEFGHHEIWWLIFGLIMTQ